MIMIWLREKPAGVLVHLKIPVGSWLREDFVMSLNIDNTNILSSCFHDPLVEEFLDKDPTDCLVRHGFIQGSDYKFFPLPMRENFLNKAKNKYSCDSKSFFRK